MCWGQHRSMAFALTTVPKGGPLRAETLAHHDLMEKEWGELASVRDDTAPGLGICPIKLFLF